MPRPHFALIIGIDEYECPKIPNLSGCVTDAKSFKECLSRTFGKAPDSDIMFLTNANATRAAILSAFRTHLICNEHIQRGQPIIIYFAGHGSRVAAPIEWAASSQSAYAETICPSDDSISAEGNLIHGIPDFTINALLRTLAREKGDNITLVCDSCHSGGVARQIGEESETVARYHSKDDVRLPANIDREILLTANGEGLEFGFHGARSSHVLLAACDVGERAYENAATGVVRGAFTAALTRQFDLRGEEIILGSVTYFDLIHSIKLKSQHPQCEGALANGFLFAGRNKIAPSVFKLTWKNTTLFVAAGAGIVKGTEMVVYKEASAVTSLGVLVVQDVGAVTATLRRKAPEDFFPVHDALGCDNPGWAQVLRWHTGDLKIFSDTSLSLLLPGPSPEYRVCQVDDKSAGHIALHAPDPKDPIRIERQGRLITTHAIRDVVIPSKLSLPFVLNGIAHFHYHLRRQMPPVTTLLEAPLISPNVGLKMYRLDRRPENGAMNPDKNNIFNKNIARLVASQNYGIKIVNKSDYSLYPYLFSFDPSDYTIEPLYQPPFTAETAPLKPGGFVTIGYGGAGGAPLQFQAPEGASDACFLKLIVSTQNIKLDHMVQSSVFKIPSKHDGSDDEPPIGVPRAKPTRAVHDVFWDMSLAILIVAPPVPSIGTAIWGRVRTLVSSVKDGT